MLTVKAMLVAGAVFALAQTGPASQPASEMSDEDRRAVEALAQELTREFEEALTSAGATDFQKRFFYCQRLAVRNAFAIPRVGRARTADLFPEIARSVDARIDSSDAVAELNQLDVNLYLMRDLIFEVARQSVPVEIDFDNCADLPNLSDLQNYTEEMTRCTEYLTEGLAPLDEPAMLRCPYADLLDPLPEYVDAYQSAISAAANELLVGEQLPEGFQIVEAEAVGVLSRAPEHCAVGSIQIEAVDEEGMEAALFIETAYAVHSQRDASLAVSFPETEMPVTQFCAERGFELSGEAEITSAKSPLEAFSDVLREALARRE